MHPRWHQLRVSVNRREGPNVADAEIPLLALGDILLFAVAESPDFVDLQALASEVPHHAVLIFGASLANVHQQFRHGVDAHPDHARRGAKGATFDQGRDNRDTLLDGQLVHTDYYA